MWSNGLTFFVFLNLHLHLCLSMHYSSSPGPARGEPRGGEAGLPRARPRGARAGAGRALGGASRARLRVARTLQGLFSAVSNSIFATVTNYSFETKHSPRSTQCIPLHGSAISNLCLKNCQKIQHPQVHPDRAHPFAPFSVKNRPKKILFGNFWLKSPRYRNPWTHGAPVRSGKWSSM